VTSFATLLAATALFAAASDEPTRFADDRLVVQFDDATPAHVAAVSARIGAPLRPLFRAPPRGWRDPAAAAAARLDSFFVARFSEPRGDLEALAQSAAREPGVHRCERCAIGAAHSTTPNDPDFPNQWALQPGHLDAPAAWDVVRTSSRVVAVIDNGGDLGQPQLANSIWTNPGEIPSNGIDDEGNGFVDDVHGWDFVEDDATFDVHGDHATRVAGAIGAAGNDGSDICGVCWSVPLLFAQVWEYPVVPPIADVAAAGVVYAADQGAGVLNVTWGFLDVEPAVVRAAVDYAVAVDAVVVSGSGNVPTDTPTYPGAWPHVLSAMAFGDDDQRAPSAGWGAWNELASPGRNILTLNLPGSPRTFSGATYATSHTSGCAALLRELVPSFDEEQVRLVLIQSARDLGPPGFDADSGWGALDLAAAVRLATTLTVDRPTASPGDDLVLTIDDPGGANLWHMVALGRFGRQPGLALSELDPADPRVVYVNEDPILLPLALGYLPGGEVLFERFMEATDGSGRSQATLHLPEGPFFLGTTLDFAAVLFDPADLVHAKRLTNTVRVRIQ